MNKARRLLFAAATVALVPAASVSHAQRGTPSTGQVIDLLFGGCLSCEGETEWPSEWCTCKGNIE